MGGLVCVAVNGLSMLVSISGNMFTLFVVLMIESEYKPTDQLLD